LKQDLRSGNPDVQENRRRRRERVIILLTVFVIVGLTYLESQISRRDVILPVSNNIMIFGLININIILIILLIFLIVRNVVKLVFERRRGVVGSKLRSKLVTAFVSLSLIPTAILFVVSINFLSYSIENWFNLRLSDALSTTVEIGQLYYGQMADRAKGYARDISADITKNRLYDKEREAYLETFIEQRQNLYKLGLMEVALGSERANIILKDPSHPEIASIPLSPKILEDIFAGSEVSTTVVLPSGEVVCGLSPVFSFMGPPEVIGFVAVSYYTPKTVVDKLGVIAKASEQYGQLKLLKTPIKVSFIIILFIVTLLIIFSATWFGVYLAKGITVPIQDLAEATNRIAAGDLDHQINVMADDEIGVLAKSFNLMTKDLKKSNQKLAEVNADLESRRKYMETVLRDVSAGVISIDGDHRLTIINRAAERMLGIQAEKVLHQRYDDLLGPDYMALVHELLKELAETGEDMIAKQIELTIKERVITVLLTLTIIRDEVGQDMGMVVVFEDITQLQKAERAAAWREVARRMAHEIKNPLTPIQLSAQRLQKKYGEVIGEDGAVFQECTKTIVDQVDVLKTLVNEFSRYARMPVTRLSLQDLNASLADAVALYQEAHKDINIHFRPGADIPPLNLDPGQIKRVMINLLDNAVFAVNPRDGHIEVTTCHDAAAHKVFIDVADNGCGVPTRYKIKMFEPYFSTKRSGTGLGLSIVSSIISDHHGRVSVRDNQPSGTVISIELPVPEA
jgi:two-component system nitrogen regulation sensor histidine kinase NtrY